MQFQFKVTIGGTEITVVETADSQAQFVEKVSFFSGLPTVGPNGETDLKFLHRTTKEGFNYYSIVSEKAGKEYNLGQSQKVPGELFGKGWADLYVAEQADTAQVATTGLGQTPVPQQVTQVVQPLQTAQVVQQPQQVTQVVQQPLQQAVAQPVVPSVTAPVAPVAPANGANQQVATDVLAKFGI